MRRMWLEYRRELKMNVCCVCDVNTAENAKRVSHLFFYRSCRNVNVIRIWQYSLFMWTVLYDIAIWQYRCFQVMHSDLKSYHFPFQQLLKNCPVELATSYLWHWNTVAHHSLNTHISFLLFIVYNIICKLQSVHSVLMLRLVKLYLHLYAHSRSLALNARAIFGASISYTWNVQRSCPEQNPSWEE